MAEETGTTNETVRNEDGVEEPEAGQSEQNDGAGKKNPHKHDSGAADLEKVTDFVEEKELAVSGAAVTSLIGPKDAETQQANRETRVVIRKEDVELIMKELEVGKVTAEKKLREYRGNVKDAMKSILGF